MGRALCDEVAQVAALGWRVIDQSERRVLGGETAPADEKLYWLFEPHTDMIKWGKVYKPVEFGHKVLLGAGTALAYPLKIAGETHFRGRECWWARLRTGAIGASRVGSRCSFAAAA
jgi:hypothetical protein